MAATVAGAAKGPPRMGLIGAVGCTTAAMGNWRRKAVASGLRPMTTESPGARLSANTGPSVRRGFVLVIGCWSTACGETSGATILIISITPTSSANALCGLCSGGSSVVLLMHAPRSWICLPLWNCVPLGWAAPQDNTPSSEVLERDSDPDLANSQDG